MAPVYCSCAREDPATGKLRRRIDYATMTVCGRPGTTHGPAAADEVALWNRTGRDAPWSSRSPRWVMGITGETPRGRAAPCRADPTGRPSLRNPRVRHGMSVSREPGPPPPPTPQANVRASVRPPSSFHSPLFSFGKWACGNLDSEVAWPACDRSASLKAYWVTV